MTRTESEPVSCAFCEEPAPRCFVICDACVEKGRVNVPPPAELAEGWHHVALRVGEAMSGTGPDGYYAFTQEQWTEWALAKLRAEPADQLAEFTAKLVASQREPDVDEMRAAREAANDVFNEPAEEELIRHCSLCEGQYIHDECDGMGLGPPEPAEREQDAQCVWSIGNPNTCVTHRAPRSGGGRCWSAEVAAARAEGARSMKERCRRIAVGVAHLLGSGAASEIARQIAVQDEHGWER